MKYSKSGDKQSYPELTNRQYHRGQWNLPDWEKRCYRLWEEARNLAGKSVDHNSPEYHSKCYGCTKAKGWRPGLYCACPAQRWEELNA